MFSILRVVFVKVEIKIVFLSTFEPKDVIAFDYAVHNLSSFKHIFLNNIHTNRTKEDLHSAKG